MRAASSPVVSSRTTWPTSIESASSASAPVPHSAGGVPPVVLDPLLLSPSSDAALDVASDVPSAAVVELAVVSLLLGPVVIVVEVPLPSSLASDSGGSPPHAASSRRERAGDRIVRRVEQAACRLVRLCAGVGRVPSPPRAGGLDPATAEVLRRCT